MLRPRKRKRLGWFWGWKPRWLLVFWDWLTHEYEPKATSPESSPELTATFLSDLSDNTGIYASVRGVQVSKARARTYPPSDTPTVWSR